MSWSALLALISGLAWFAFAVANMSGALTDLLNPDVLGMVVRETGLGVVWTARMGGAALLVALTFFRSSRAPTGYDPATTLLAAALLGSLAGVGHAQGEDVGRHVAHFRGRCASSGRRSMAGRSVSSGAMLARKRRTTCGWGGARSRQCTDALLGYGIPGCRDAYRHGTSQ